MAIKTTLQKVECLNPQTGHRMNIDKTTYELFSKAIYHVLKGSRPLSFTEIEEGVYDCFRKQKNRFQRFCRMVYGYCEKRYGSQECNRGVYGERKKIT